MDCCGHDIIVREEECIDITQLPAIKALKAQERHRSRTYAANLSALPRMPDRRDSGALRRVWLRRYEMRAESHSGVVRLT